MRTAGTRFAIAIATAVVTAAPVLIWATSPGAPRSGASGARSAEAPSKDLPDEASTLIVTGDFNRDGIADMAEATLSAGDRSSPGLLTMFLGRRDGTFRRMASYPLQGRHPQSIVVGDFNGDGNQDVIVGDSDGSVIELLGDGAGNLTPAGEITHLGSVASIAIGDFNHDGILDLAISDPTSNSVTILLGTGHGSFQSSWSFPLPMKGVVFHIAAADFNGDGITDLAITNDNDDAYEIMLGNGNGTFTYAPALSNVKDPNAYCPT